MYQDQYQYYYEYPYSYDYSYSTPNSVDERLFGTFFPQMPPLGQGPGFGPPFTPPGQSPGGGPPFSPPGQGPGFGPPFTPPSQGPGGGPPFTPPGQGPESGPPTSPPPSFVPQQQAQAFAVDPGGIRRCLFRFTYIWLRGFEQFWFYPIFVGRNSVSGYRWTGFRWVYFGISLRQIQSFTCV